MAGYQVVQIYRGGGWFASTDQSLVHAVFANVRARLPQAKLFESGPMPDGCPVDFSIGNVPKSERRALWFLKLFCEHGGEPFAVDEYYFYVRFKD